MANIINDVSDRKKDLYNHVSFSELYEYSDTLLTLTEHSRKLFSNYISEANKNLGDAIAKMEAGRGVDLKAVDTVLRLPVDGKDGEAPAEICFSLAPLVDSLSGSIITDDEVMLLEIYLNLGFYPVVTMPMGLADIRDTFEKYDNCNTGRKEIGAIVGLLKYSYLSNGEQVSTPVAVVMWNPNFVSEYDQTMYENFRGNLTIRDMKVTPNCWRTTDGVGSETNTGVLLYEYTPNTVALNRINSTHGLPEFVNEALVTGHLKLDFADNIMRQLSDMTAKMREISSKYDVPIVVAEQKPDEDEPVDPPVPVEDAKEDDRFGHLLRLYNDPVPIPDDDDEDIFFSN